MHVTMLCQARQAKCIVGPSAHLGVFLNTELWKLINSVDVLTNGCRCV